MKKTRLITLAVIALALTGCTTYRFTETNPDGASGELAVRSFMRKSEIGKLNLKVGDKSLDVEGLSLSADASIVEAAARGAVEAAVKSAVPVP